MKTIISAIDKYLERTGRRDINPVEANEMLSKSGLLRDSKDRPGKPLRELLRKGQIPHAFQSGGKGSEWTIPHSNKSAINDFKNLAVAAKQVIPAMTITQQVKPIDKTRLRELLEKARLKYKPETIKYLLIAEAPPDSIDRFFYYESVQKHDYLFLGIAHALYPELKEKFLSSHRSSDIKISILKKLQENGFYLVDLSELPLSLSTGDLVSQLPTLANKIKNVVNVNTKIILIKATVYDVAFHFLKTAGFNNLIDIRIPFPAQGGQTQFQEKFSKALIISGYEE